MDSDFIAGFLEESDDLFRQAESLCLKAEENGSLNDEDMGALFRAVHTLKGSGAAVDLKIFPKFVHDVETFMDKLRKKELAYLPEMAGVLMDTLDKMKELLYLEAENGTVSDSVYQELSTDVLTVIRGYLGVQSNSSGKKSVESIQAAVVASKKIDEDDKHSDAKKVGGASIRVSLDKIDLLMNEVGNLVITNSMLAELSIDVVEPALRKKFDEKLSLLEREIRALQDAVMNVRMVPMETIYSKFPKMIRDISKKLNKKINFNHLGDAVEIDKATIEGLTDPLMHIIRNSLDHGIEDAKTRILAGKKEEGTIVISAEATSGQIVITITDDGGGINTAKVCEKALKSGIITQEEFLKMTEPQKAMLIFAAGLSTATEVTDISGRGVGMDVVRTNIEALGGKIAIDTQKGLGTSIKIALPLTLAILDGLNIKIGNEIYIVPLNLIHESLQPQTHMIKYIGEGKTVFLHQRNEFIPILRLSDTFNIVNATQRFEDGILIVLRSSGNKKIAIFVDQFLNQQQFVVKPLDKNFIVIPGFSGATIKGNGSISLIVDPFAFDIEEYEGGI